MAVRSDHRKRRSRSRRRRGASRGILRYLRRAVPHGADTDALLRRRSSAPSHPSILPADADARIIISAIATRLAGHPCRCRGDGQQGVERTVGGLDGASMEGAAPPIEGRSPLETCSGGSPRAAPRPCHAEAPRSGLRRHRRLPRLPGRDRTLTCSRPCAKSGAGWGSEEAIMDEMAAVMSTGVLLAPLTLVGAVLAWAESEDRTREPTGRRRGTA